MSIVPIHINDSAPYEEEIEWSVQWLRTKRFRCPSVMRTEHLWQWMWYPRNAEAAEAMLTEAGEGKMTQTGKVVDMDPLDLSYLKKVVELIQADFREGWLDEENTWRRLL